MKFKPTKSQRDAMTAKGNILVSAAAGSGKTAVLTERVIGMLTDKDNPVSADRLLIVTFTNAAAKEMRSRIEKRLYEECSDNPDDSFLIKQRHLLDSADICTIDSFCINIVRENFEKCGVEPDFKVSDGSELKSGCDRLLSDIIDNRLLSDRKRLDKLLQITGCEYNDDNLKDLIKNLYLFSYQQPFPSLFLENLVKPYRMAFNKKHHWYTGAFELADEYIAEAQSHFVKMADTVPLMEVDSEKINDYTVSVSLMLNELEEAVNTGDFNLVKEKIEATQLGRIVIGNKNGEIGEIFKNERKSLIETFKKINAVFCNTSEEIDTDIKNSLPYMELLTELVYEYSEKVFELFDSENTLAFYHTEQMALGLLCQIDSSGEIMQSELAKTYFNKYDEVLVDEFQDVNDLQNTLFHILSENSKKLFVVGDIKQSIYRFRGSNLNNFLNKKKTYLPFEFAGKDDAKKIILSDNFRSRKGICDFVNFVFGNIMRDDTGEIVYNGEEKLNAGAEFPEINQIENELIILEDNDDGEGKGYVTEAEVIAEYIKKTVNSGFKVSDGNGGLRLAEYRDFAVLLDSFSNKAPILAKALNNLKIPVDYSEESYCESAEISLALSMLTVLDNPQSDIELLSVMMSPIFGFSPEDMAKMRIDERNGNIYVMTVKAAQSGNQKAVDFINKIKALRNDMSVMPLDKFILSMIYDTGLLSIVSTMKNGKQRRNNLLALPRYAASFNYSPGEFVKKIKDIPTGSIKTDLSGNNAVRIMSMHKSKGLQFPICILSSLSSRINRDDAISRIVYKDSLGIGYKYFDEEEEQEKENIGRKIISRKILKENTEEKMRLLYVAMTRAQERLIMVTSHKNCCDTVSRIAGSIENGVINADFIKSTVSMSDWILATCLLHPDAENLRKLGEISIKPTHTDSKLKVNILDLSQDIEIIAEEPKIADADLNLAEAIRQNNEYEYPYEELTEIRSKATVTGISHKENSEYSFKRVPSFLSGDGMSGSDRGTALHSFLQFADFTNHPDIDAQIERLKEWQFITEEQADCIDREKISYFFNSHLYKRIISSEMFKREMRFLTEMPAYISSPEISEKNKNHPVMIQGAVDLLFFEDDEIIIVDFKTDSVNSQDELINSYKQQLDIYAEAVKKIFGKKIKEKIIYSFCLNKEIVV